jgi:C4-dicarboxylate-binding protein DctP
MKYIFFAFYFLLFSTAFSAEKSTELHWGINLEPLHYFKPTAVIFKKNVEERTQGRVTVKLSIGKYKQEQRDHLQDIVDGTYDMGQETVINLQKEDPSLSLWELPFLFTSNEQVFEFTKSKYARSIFKNLEKKGVVAVEYTYSGGFLYFYGNQVNDLKDLKGKTIAFEEHSKDFGQMISKKLNIKVKNYGEGSNLLEASEIISSTTDELIHVPLKKRAYLNLTKHRVSARVLFLSEKFLSKLSESDKLIVLDEARRAAVIEREMAVGLTDVFNNMISKKGTKIHRWSKSKRLDARKLFKEQYSEFNKTFGEDIINYIDSINK